MKFPFWASLGLAALASLFAITAHADPPANDNFDSPVVITGFPATVYGSNIEATVETGESLPDGYDYAVESVWYTWTAPASGLVQIDTFGSHEDGL